MKEEMTKRIAPTSVRGITEEMWTAIDDVRGDLPRNAWIIHIIEDAIGSASPIDGRRRPSAGVRVLLGQILGTLGQSNLVANVQALADAARTGSLLDSPDTVAEIQQILGTLRQIQEVLLKALRRGGD